MVRLEEDIYSSFTIIPVLLTGKSIDLFVLVFIGDNTMLERDVEISRIHEFWGATVVRKA